MTKHYYNALAPNYIDGPNVLNSAELIDAEGFYVSQLYKNIPENQLSNPEALLIKNDEQPIVVDVQKFPEREIPSDKIIVSQHNIKFVPVSNKNSNWQIEKLNRSFDRIRNQEWPDDMQPSKETIDRAESLCKAIQHAIFEFGVPNISAAEENSVDIFWGDTKERILVNIPSDEKEDLFAHFINSTGQTIINFSDSHSFNIINLVRQMRGSVD